MKKNWLIRTHDFHIYGPVTREKILELISNGSLKDQDELCTGNGHWFHIKEKGLIDTYLMREIEQGFNPITEAKDVKLAYTTNLVTPKIPSSAPKKLPVKDAEADAKFPEQDDLEYPDITDFHHLPSSSTMAAGESKGSSGKTNPNRKVALEENHEKAIASEDNKYPSGLDLDYPDLVPKTDKK